MTDPLSTILEILHKHDAGFPLSFRYNDASPSDRARTVETVADTPDFIRQRITERLPDGCLTLVNTVTVYRDFPVVEWLPELVNEGDQPSGIVSDFHSLSLSIDLEDRSTGYIDTHYTSTCHYPLRDVALRRTLGSKNCQSDFTAETVFLRPRYPENHVRLDTDEGRSSAAWLPFFGLDITDKQGINVGIGWSGRWFAEFRHNGDSFSVEAGMPETHFRVLPGERLRQPSIFIHRRNGLSVEDGQNELRRFLLKYHSPHHADGSIVRTPFPLTEWGGQTTEGLLRTIATKVRHDLPFDTFWVDAGWFGDDRPVSPTEYGNSDWARTVGNWRVNQVPHPGGFKPVSEAAHKAGMKFLLWVEMERVAPDTPVAREHPEWLLSPKSAPYSLLLNLGDDRAREWAIAQVDRLVREEGVDYYRQDFNFNTIPYWYDNDAPDRVGVTEMKYIAGLYRFWDTLRERFPDMLIDNCASGGRRIDFETNSRSICLYRSDMLGRPWYDCAEPNHVEIPYLSAWVPLHSGGTTVLPGDDYAYFSGVTTGTDGPVFDEKLPFDPVWYREVLITAHRMADCFYGDFYLLTERPESRKGLYAYQCHLPKENRGFFAVFRRPEGDECEFTPALRVLDPAARYEVETFRGGVETLTGAGLLSRAVRLNTPRSVRVVFYRRLPEKPATLIVATHNKNKLREIGQILPGWDISGEDAGVEETGATFAENALIKARAVAARHPGAWVLADDSGLVVDALGGAPGVRSARYAGRDGDTPANNALLLKNLAGVTDRRAHFACSIALISPDGTVRHFEGRCDGHIAESPSGEGGFGYDPLFIPNGYNRSFAELAPAEKNAISHRGRALAALRAALALH